MKRSIKKLVLISAIVGMIGVCFTGCNSSAKQESTESGTSSVSSTQNSQTPSSESEKQETTEPDTSSDSSTQTSQATSSDSEKQEATLYIGKGDTFKEYTLEYEGELKPETLIQGISDLTGWDLTLSDEVTTGKGGMTVSFAKTSALFVGPPETQKEEFFMYDADNLIPTILDSVKKTLQQNFVDSSVGGDPDSLDIYYCMEGDQPLTFENINVTIPMDTPYTTFPEE